MTDYTKLVEALRCCATCDCDSEKCKYIGLGMDEDVSCIMAITKDAADAIEALQAENPIVETVLEDKLRQRIDELEEKQTYCDAYGDKWMTSGKDVPTEAYKHGYADGWDEATAKMQKSNAELHAELERWISAAEQAGESKRGEWIRHPEVKNIYGGEYIECPFCGEKYVVQYIADEKFCRNCGADMRKMEVQE